MIFIAPLVPSYASLSPWSQVLRLAWLDLIRLLDSRYISSTSIRKKEKDEKQAIWVPNIRIAQVATRLSFNHAPIHTIATSAFGLCAATGDYDVVAAAAGDEWSSS